MWSNSEMMNLLGYHDLICGGFAKKIENVSHTLSCTLFTKRDISEEDP